MPDRVCADCGGPMRLVEVRHKRPAGRVTWWPVCDPCGTANPAPPASAIVVERRLSIVKENA